MKNRINITDIKRNNNKIEYIYSVEGEWKKYFKLEEKFFVEYEENITSVPYGIAIVPFLCNVMPIAWIFDATININEIDEDFYKSIPKFKQGYINMFPKVDFLGEINVANIIKNEIKNTNNSIALFSGGVDAFHTFLGHIEEKPCLTTLWGSDVKLDDIEGWDKVANHVKDTAELYNVDYTFIKSSFRYFLNESALTKAVYERANDGWWHGFQHGIGLIGHAAPLAFINNVRIVYIAASFTIQEKGKVTCASDPTIDDNVKFCGCDVKHDGYEAARQDKIEAICKYSKENNINIPLRVCWQSTGGSNCCKCEKCYRTIFGILAEKGNPKNYGFDYSDEEFNEIIKDLKNRVSIGNFRWEYIQNSFRKNYTIEEVDKRLLWFYKRKNENLDKTLVKQCRKFKKSVRSKLSVIKKKII